MDKNLFQKKAEIATKFCQEHNLINPRDLKVYWAFPELLMAMNINKMEMALNPHPDLNNLMMDDGEQTTQEWLETQPQEWRAIETEAIYECLKRGWTLNVMTIQSTARELDAKRNPKGW